MAKVKFFVKGPNVSSFTIKKVPDFKKQNFNFKKGLHIAVIAALLVAGFNFPYTQTQAATGSNLAATAEGNYTAWTASSGTKVAAVASNDSSYITATSNSAAETFAFANSSPAIPAGATINSVTLYGYAAKGTSTDTSFKFRVEKGTGIGSQSDGSTVALTSTNYSLQSRAMTTDPFTSAAWTLSQVNNWTYKFGVVKSTSNGSVRINQLYVVVDYTANVIPAANPTLAQSCGVDVALVLDNSGSIGTNLGTMKTDFNSFVGSFLPATPSYFSVTYFDTAAHYELQTMSNNVSTITTAINAVPTANGFTNWQQGLINAQGTFTADGRSHLVVFASDGDPDELGNPATSASETDALNAAVTQANTMKSAGTRIVTLGLGSSVNQANLEAISSNDAYYSTSDFSGLPAALTSIATALCGGTITVHKVISQNGNTISTGSSVDGWQFNVAGTSETTNGVGGSNGVTPSVSVNVNGGPYSVSETSVNSGYTLSGGSCTGSSISGGNGTFSGSGVSGIKVGNNDIISCTFTNTANPGTLTVIKHVIGGTNVAGDFTLNVSGGTPSSFPGSESGTSVTVNAGVSYAVTESSSGPANYVATYSADCLGTMPAGGIETCTVTNTYVAPSPTPTPVPSVTPTPTSTPSPTPTPSATPTPVDTTFHFIKQICPSYSDITGNGAADNFDATGGNYTQFINYSVTAPHFPPTYGSKPISPSEIPGSCAPAAGWNFQLSTDQAQTQNVSTVGPTDGTGTVNVDFNSLPSAVQTSLTGGGQLWVSEVGQPAVASFGALRCYQDALNGDNLEMINLGNDPTQYPTDVYCIAYNVSAPVVSPSPTPVVSPTGGGGSTNVADPAVVKTENGSPVPGATITYTLVASNNGTADATGVVVTDPLPGTVTYVSDDSTTTAPTTTTSYDATTTTLTWNIGTLAVGTSQSIDITATVNANASGSVDNTATISNVGGGDSNIPNDTSTAGGAIPTPTPVPTSGGGGSSGSSGSSGGGGSSFVVSPTPTPSSGGGSVLGANTTVPSGSGLQVPAVGQVLGASTTLPRTGIPPTFLLVLLVGLAGGLVKKFKLV